MKIHISILLVLIICCTEFVQGNIQAKNSNIEKMLLHDYRIFNEELFNELGYSCVHFEKTLDDPIPRIVCEIDKENEYYIEVTYKRKYFAQFICNLPSANNPEIILGLLEKAYGVKFTIIDKINRKYIYNSGNKSRFSITITDDMKILSIYVHDWMPLGFSLEKD